MITVAVEPLSWPLLVYWITKHPDDGPVCLMPSPIVVARRDGEIVGFAGLSVRDTLRLQTPVLAPLFADNIRIGFRLVDVFEQELRAMEQPFYLFFVHLGNKPLVSAIERLETATRLWTTEAGFVWYRRDLPRTAPEEAPLKELAEDGR